jgi:hypothetical protein
VNLELSIRIFVEQYFETINCSNIEVQRLEDYFGKMVETKVLRILHPKDEKVAQVDERRVPKGNMSHTNLSNGEGFADQVVKIGLGMEDMSLLF